MRSKRTKQFRALYQALPESVRQQADYAYHLFAANPSHPGLDFKQVSKKGPTYSASGLVATRNTTNYWINCNSPCLLTFLRCLASLPPGSAQPGMTTP